MLEMSQGTAPGARIHDGPLYRTPMFAVLATAATLPIVGQARAALRGFRKRLESRIVMGDMKKQSELSSTQIRLAKVEIGVQQAELLLRNVVAEAMRLRNEASVVERARWMAQLATVMDQSRQCIWMIADASGASAHRTSDPLQRMVRDANTMSAHAFFDLDGRLELFGKLSLGHAPAFVMV
jgi:alkylation response protein AidB-like acyl-CoA dehydrogenase